MKTGLSLRENCRAIGANLRGNRQSRKAHKPISLILPSLKQPK